MMAELKKILVNGRATDTISVLDRGLQFGDGLFETIRIHDGRPVWWGAHMERLLSGCRQLRFTPLPDTELLLQEANGLAATIETGVLKIILTRGNSNTGYGLPENLSQNRILILSTGDRHRVNTDEGIHLGLCEHRISSAPGLSGIKHLNRLDQVLARIECADHGWDEGVMLDKRDFPIEGTMSNLFAWFEDKLLTPSLETSGVQGICREFILEHAKSAGYAPEECDLSVSELRESDGLMVCNSLIGIWPVRKFLDQQFVIGNRTRQLQQAVREAMCS